MVKKLSVCVVTGSRADYSCLYFPIKYIIKSPKLRLQLAVTGSHLEKKFGNTVKYIKEDGFKIDAEIPISMTGNDAVSVTKSLGRGVIGFAEALVKLKPDILLVLGDRFEILAAVEAALIAGIPVAHISGGDITEGAFDDAIRHGITKMSHIHFVSNDESKQRVLQMGENPANVYVTGAPSLDVIRNIKYSTKKTFLRNIGLKQEFSKYVLVTYHPETISGNKPEEDAIIILAALSELEHTGIIFTGANADTGGSIINDIFQGFASKNSNTVFHMSLGKERFYNALKHVDVFIGNSSSGLYEAPSFQLPVVNIGDRQKGRLRTKSVIDCALNKEAIYKSIKKAYSMDCSKITNPYGDGKASERIVKVLEAIKESKSLLRKKFFKYKSLDMY